MKRVGKPAFFIVALLIAIFTYLTFFGVSTSFGDTVKTIVKGADDIRWGIDIRGGVDVTFTPPEGVDATENELNAAKSVIEQRLVSQNITDYEIYTDMTKDRIIVRFPWKTGEADFNPEKAVQELGETALLTFREGTKYASTGYPEPSPDDPVVLMGNQIETATAVVQDNVYMVSLELKSEGAKSFSDATARLAKKGYISIWMDDMMISAPNVESHITEGKAVITGNFTAKSAQELANKINSGALPFKLETKDYNSISPTLGTGAKDAMIRASIIAFVLICIFMLVLYRLPGAIACIALAGQAAGMVAAITGFFPAFNSFTLTLPGIAGIILSIGMGVDANIITSERIKEELKAGKTLDTAIENGYDRGFSAIFDSNITVIFVAVVLMGAFGPPSSVSAKMMGWLFSMFGSSTAGAIYSFGYTLLWGIILNFIMGVTASRIMLKSISRFKTFRAAWMYGGAK